MDLKQLQRFFGICTVVNFAVYTLGALFLLVFKDFTLTVYDNFFDIAHDSYDWLSFIILGIWKALIFVFNLTPYVALRMINK